MVPFSFEKKNSAIKESGKSFDRYVNVCEDINKFRLNGGFKINGDSEPFLKPSFSDSCFAKKNPGVRKWWFGTPSKFETPIQWKIVSSV